MKKQEPETQKKSDLTKENIIRGVITARTCESCGHHEIGIITERGDYLSLMPGMVVEVIKE